MGTLFGACPAMPDGPRYRGHGHDTPRRGGTLMLADESRVRTLDPQVAMDTISGTVIEMLFEPLYAYDHDMELVPRVASALPEVSDDGLVFTVPLRKDVRFHHGRLLTAEDVVYTMERMLAPETGSSTASLYDAVEGYEAFRTKQTPHLSGVRALDPHRVEFRLTRPDQSFRHLLAMRTLSPVPREIVEQRGAKFARHPVGAGPFRLASWDPGVRIVLERHPHYYRKGLPYLDGVLFQESVSSDTNFLRFRNGEVDIVVRMTPADRALLSTPKWRPYVKKSPTIDVYALFMNCEIPPFDNVHVRRAVAFAIDRERWARARSGSLVPTGQIVPPALMGYDPNLPNAQRFDLDKAREEMRLAGYPNGLPTPVTMWVGDQPKSRVYGALAQADLAKIGIQLELKAVSFPVYLASTATRGVVQMFAGGWVMDYPDPSNFLGLLHSRGIHEKHASNKAFYKNPELDRLLDEALVERDQEKREALYRAANDLVAKEAPWAFFANQAVPQAFQPYVRDYRPHPAYWIPVNEVWLDLPRERVARARRLDAASFALLGPLMERLP